MALTRSRSTYFIGTYYLGRYSYSFHEQRLGVSSFFFCILWSCQSGRQCPCQQNACLKNTVFWIKQEQTGRPKSKVSTYNAQEAWDGCEGGDQVPTYQGQLLHLWSPWWSSCPNITRVPDLSPPLPYVSIKLYVLLYIAITVLKWWLLIWHNFLDIHESQSSKKVQGKIGRLDEIKRRHWSQIKATFE